jgi:glycine/sarcosine N-methyltransferase
MAWHTPARSRLHNAAMVDNGDVRAFYDDLSADYHRMFPDWEASSRRQGAVLSALLADLLGRGTVDILDCACGIGTQLIGLAVLGHRLSGSDLSSAAVERARVECALAGVEADLRTADMRNLPFPDQAFDAVICADNSLPHLLTEAEVLAAAGQLHRVLRPGGVAIVTTRDYDSTRVES